MSKLRHGFLTAEGQTTQRFLILSDCLCALCVSDMKMAIAWVYLCPGALARGVCPYPRLKLWGIG